jgi:HEAT repeat protein
MTTASAPREEAISRRSSPTVSSDVALIVELAELAEATYDTKGKEATRNLVVTTVSYDAVRSAIRLGDELTRRKSLGLLHYFDPKIAARELVDALRGDPCPIVRHEAAYYLATLKRPETVQPLIEALRTDPVDLVRHEAAEALGDMGATYALSALNQALNDSSDTVVRTVRIAIAQLSKNR